MLVCGRLSRFQGRQLFRHGGKAFRIHRLKTGRIRHVFFRRRANREGRIAVIPADERIRIDDDILALLDGICGSRDRFAFVQLSAQNFFAADRERHLIQFFQHLFVCGKVDALRRRIRDLRLGQRLIDLSHRLDGSALFGRRFRRRKRLCRRLQRSVFFRIDHIEPRFKRHFGRDRKLCRVLYIARKPARKHIRLDAVAGRRCGCFGSRGRFAFEHLYFRNRFVTVYKRDVVVTAEEFAVVRFSGIAPKFAETVLHAVDHIIAGNECGIR